MGNGAAVRIPWFFGLGAAVAALACRPEAAPPVAETASPSLPPGPTSAPAPRSPDPAPGASARTVTASGPARFAFDFEDADLPALVRLVGGITGKRFILSGPLPAVRATVHSPEPVTADEAYGAFLSILQANGLTVVQAGPFWKIMASPGR